MAKLTKVKIGKIVAQKRYGLSSSLIGKNVGVSKRRVNQVLKEYKDKGEYPRISKLEETGTICIKNNLNDFKN